MLGVHSRYSLHTRAVELGQSTADSAKKVSQARRPYPQVFPYLDMTAALQSALREPDTALFVAGFSFSDSHIAQPIMSALESNMSFRIIVCDSAFLDDASIAKNPVAVAPATTLANSIHKKLVKLAEAGDERITLLHGRFEDLALALPDLVAETERERHAQRMRTLREVDAKAGASKL